MPTGIPKNGINTGRFKSGAESRVWKGGKSKCVDCKKTLSHYDRIRCQKCYGILLKKKVGKLAPRWQGGRPKCIDCGKIVVSYKAIRCGKCDRKRESPIDTRIKMSISMMGKNSKGGITPINQKIRQSIEFRLWRESVFARDNWTCQKYLVRGGKLHSHHIQNFSQYPELRFAIDNGITLSEKAHKEFHKKYGKQNNTKEQLKEFLCL